MKNGWDDWVVSVALGIVILFGYGLVWYWYRCRLRKINKEILELIAFVAEKAKEQREREP